MSTKESVEAALKGYPVLNHFKRFSGWPRQPLHLQRFVRSTKVHPLLNKQVSTTGMIGTTGTTITMTANTEYLIGTIPVGSRPAYDQMIAVKTSAAMGGNGTPYIRANGDIHLENSATFSGLAKASFFIALDNIAWNAL